MTQPTQARMRPRNGPAVLTEQPAKPSFTRMTEHQKMWLAKNVRSNEAVPEKLMPSAENPKADGRPFNAVTLRELHDFRVEARLEVSELAEATGHTEAEIEAFEAGTSDKWNEAYRRAVGGGRHGNLR